jgi:hypothetical protein
MVAYLQYQGCHRWTKFTRYDFNKYLMKAVADSSTGWQQDQESLLAWLSISDCQVETSRSSDRLACIEEKGGGA